MLFLLVFTPTLIDKTSVLSLKMVNVAGCILFTKSMECYMLKILIIFGLLGFAYWVIRYLSKSQQNQIVTGLVAVLGSAAIIFIGFELFR